MKKSINMAAMKATIEAFERGELSESAATAKLLSETRTFLKGVRSQSNLMDIRPFESRMGHAKAFRGRKTAREVV
ncbi:hypothetical protein pEaSNUABM56_00185 [Erwinia phage pEa_SNUABM_56]|uniref:Uncharacterized protein n=1 Tax=Erwinia phage pEp_SNUABM_01 TaxID=2601643 RepID=A0A5J6DB61_9CAUD|nr:hypothetical protein HWC63_gp217 [Erwinia phage pEp_SNUABM_01]QEQ94961.1 hypothetical protein pEpSNUABM01_135 [Erwinia phage pEp_SNUABM_01]UYL84886.1 hypothetical protein pEaSNUABM55_00113 [Erwinia phage pEa_SNUABM_55]UYL85205.1 hypothetical protein pEaSNUABM56_00185 [Erwinia phage pEa_SNUABM_56]